MTTVYDLLAKISWDTNAKELEQIVDLSKQEAKMLEELRLKGERLEKQMVKTNDPAKLKKYNDELQETAKRANAITTAQKKQADSIEDLKKKQKDFLEQLKKVNDPKAVQGLLRGLHQVENQLAVINKQAATLPTKVGGIGKELFSGLVGGVVGGGIVGATQVAFSAIANFVGNATAEFDDAERTALNLNRTLKVIGQSKYFEGLQTEASELSAKFHNLFDNDDILKAQTALVNYGKVSRNEISKLTPVILELATAERIDLAQATEKIIGIMEGRGGQTLREYGLSVKGVKSEHDRLNVVLGEFSTKLQGSADVYAQTAQGIEQANAVMLANVEEQLGSYTSRISMVWQKTKLGFFQMLDDMIAGRKGREEKAKASMVSTFAGEATGLSDEELAAQLKQNKLRSKELLRIEDELNEAYKAKHTRANFAYINQLKSEFDKQATIIQSFYDENERRRNGSAKKDNEAINKNADLFEEKEEKAAKKAAEKKVRVAKKESIDLVKLKEDEFKQTLTNLEDFHESELNKILIQLSDKKITEEEYREKVVEEELAYYQYRITAYLDYGKNIDRISNEQLRKLQDYNKREKKSPKGVTGEFVPGTQGDTAVPEGFTSAFASDPEITATRVKEAEINKITADAIKERKKMQRQELFDNVQMLAGEISNILAQEEARTQKSISLQEKRIEEAKKSSTASVKIEEDRLNTLLAKREKYEKAQRIIDAAVIVANQAVAISGAIKAISTSSNFVEVAANVAAIIAGIAASTAAVRSAYSDNAGFYEGGYTGDGDPKQESTAQGKRGYKYHKKEFVMNAGLTEKHRDMFEGIHKGDLMVKQIGDGYYLAPSVDVDKAVNNHDTAKALSSPELAAMGKMLASIDSRLAQRELIVNNNFDDQGFGNSVAGQLNAITLKNLMR